MALGFKLYNLRVLINVAIEAINSQLSILLPREKMDIVYGRNPVLEALRGRRKVKEIRIVESKSAVIKEIADLAKERNIPVKLTSRAGLDRLTLGGLHQGIAAQVASYEFTPLALFLAALEDKPTALVLLLDGITDPQNLGSIIRTAECCGAGGIIIPKARTAPITPAVAKASAGALEHVTMVQANLADAAERLKNDGFWLVGAEAGTGLTLWEFDWPAKIAIVLGGEGSGISQLMKKKCDYLVGIPIYGRIPSLNVSASAAVILYEFARSQLR